MNLPFCDIPIPDISGVSPERAEAIVAEANNRYGNISLGTTAWRVAGVATVFVIVPLTILSQPFWLIFIIALTMFILIYLPLVIFSVRSNRRAMVQFIEHEIEKNA